MKKFFIFCLMAISLVMLSGCGKKEVEKPEPAPAKTDAILFKEDYESLNGKENASGKAHRNVTISEDNPFVLSNAKEVIEKIENGDSFYIYFGDKQCPWCRSVVETAIKMADEYSINKIYYVNIWDDDHNEILRDTYELNEETGKPELVKEGAEEYQTLLKYLDKVLTDYTLTNDKGKKIKVGEKRIYAPNYIYIKNGKANLLTEGYTDTFSDSRAELTPELIKDQEEQFKEFFEKTALCDEAC